jgi:hypothetical protein
MQSTTLNRPWLFKVAVFFLIFFLFGLYGWYDAAISYPRRGQRFAEAKLFDYLNAVQKEGGALTSRVNVDNPAETLADLKAKKRNLSESEQRKLEWLESLQVIGRLKPEYTKLADPNKKWTELSAQWATGGQPKALEWYDIPVQWTFVAIGLGGAAWLAFLYLMVARVKYQWDETSRTLTLPTGATLTPADLEDVDKRKWDKYIVFLKIKPAHAGLGGRELKLDLYRYAPLESWILEMERAAFPDREQDQEPKGGEPVEPAEPDERH